MIVKLSVIIAVLACGGNVAAQVLRAEAGLVKKVTG